MPRCPSPVSPEHWQPNQHRNVERQLWPLFAECLVLSHRGCHPEHVLATEEMLLASGELRSICPVDHEQEFKCKVYENGRVVADLETLRQLARFSERQIRKGTGVDRDTIRLIRHGKGVKRSTYERVINFLSENESPSLKGTRCTHLSENMPYRDPAQRERPGYGSTASGSVLDRWVSPRLCHPHLLSCVHQSLRASPSKH